MVSIIFWSIYIVIAAVVLYWGMSYLYPAFLDELRFDNTPWQDFTGAVSFVLLIVFFAAFWPICIFGTLITIAMEPR